MKHILEIILKYIQSPEYTKELNSISRTKQARGLCYATSVLIRKDGLTTIERKAFKQYLADDRKNQHIFYCLEYDDITVNKTKERDMFVWPPYAKAPRINWLKKHIKLNS